MIDEEFDFTNHNENYKKNYMNNTIENKL